MPSPPPTSWLMLGSFHFFFQPLLSNNSSLPFHHRRPSIWVEPTAPLCSLTDQARAAELLLVLESALRAHACNTSAGDASTFVD